MLQYTSLLTISKITKPKRHILADSIKNCHNLNPKANNLGVSLSGRAIRCKYSALCLQAFHCYP